MFKLIKNQKTLTISKTEEKTKKVELEDIQNIQKCTKMEKKVPKGTENMT